MYTCVICHFDFSFDDVVVRRGTEDKVICLRCYQREVGDVKPMPKELRRYLIQALAELSSAE